MKREGGLAGCAVAPIDHLTLHAEIAAIKGESYHHRDAQRPDDETELSQRN